MSSLELPEHLKDYFDSAVGEIAYTWPAGADATTEVFNLCSVASEQIAAEYCNLNGVLVRSEIAAIRKLVGDAIILTAKSVRDAQESRISGKNLSRLEELRLKTESKRRMVALEAALRSVATAEPPYSGDYLMRELKLKFQFMSTRTEIITMLEVIATEVAKRWIDNGGSEIDTRLTEIVDDVCRKLADEVDLSRGEWDFYDDEGMPCRPSYSTIVSSFKNVTEQQITDAVRHKIGFQSHGWVGFSAMALLDQFVARYSVEVEILDSVIQDDEDFREDLEAWKAVHPAPSAQPYGISPIGAEHWVKDWLTHMGAQNAAVTQFVGDGGIDVTADGLVAQVKLYSSTAAISELRELVGAAAVQPGRPKMLYFCSGGFPRQAETFANQVGMALFRFTPETGSVTAENEIARKILGVGLLTP